MNKEQSKLIIVEIIQNALIGQLKPDCNFNPQHVADAINQRIDFDSSSAERFNREVIETIISSIEDCKKDLDIQFDSLDQEKEKLLRNFIRGKSIAYEEILDILNKL